MSQAPTATSLIGKPMSKILPSIPITRTARTFRVERELPRSGAYAMHIHREVVNTDEAGKVLSIDQCTDSYNEPVAKMVERKATAQYLADCNAAKTIIDLIHAEATLYDALVAEVESEKAKE